MGTVSLVFRDVARKSARLFLPGPLFRAVAEWYNKRCCKQHVRDEDYERFVSLLYGGVTTPDGSVVQVNIDRLQHPLYARSGTPDAVEIVHSVIREAYGKYLPEGEVKFVVDAGAYIGDATAWYLSRFPASRVVALEPNPESFAMLQRNCAAYGSRARTINGALWFQDGNLDLVFDPTTPTGNSVASRIEWEQQMLGRVHCRRFWKSPVPPRSIYSRWTLRELNWNSSAQMQTRG